MRQLEGRDEPAKSTGSLAREDNCLYTIRVLFEWDPRKAHANLRAHGIGFAEAVTVLEDAFALTRDALRVEGEQATKGTL